MPLKSENMKFVSFDFDGTLVETSSEDNWSLEQAQAIQKNIDILREEVKKKRHIFIYTSRASAEFDDIKKWLRRHKIPWRQIETGKLLTRTYWDDRAVNPYCNECLEREGYGKKAKATP